MSKIQVNEVVNHFDNGAPDFPRGVTVTGISTVNGNIDVNLTNVTVSGILTATSFSGDGTALTGIAGTANVSTNTLSVSGVSTLSSGVFLPEDQELKLGGSAADPDFKIYNDSTSSYINSTQAGAYLRIISAGGMVMQVGGNENSLFAAQNGKVSLYYDGSEKIETTSTGVEVTGNITVNGENYPTSGSLSNRNKVINGAMNIAQRSTSQAVGAGYKTVDRFNVSFANGNVAQEQHALNSGDTGPWAQGFREAFRLTNTGTSTGPMSFREINYIMEAQDVATMGWDYNNTNSFVTLSFWAKASVTQTYYLSLVNDDGAYMRTHPLALTAGVWKYFEIAIPGDSNLTFNMDNGVGLRIRFIPFYGIIYTGSVADNTWRSAAGPDYLPDMTNTWAGTTDATFDVTGVQFELGSKATPFEFRSTGDELLKCQRYFIRQDWALCNNIYGIAYRWIPPGPSVNMRTAPSMSYFNPNTGTANQTYEHSSGTARTINSSPAALSATSGSTIYFGTSTNGTYGQYVRVHMDAELS